MAYSQNTYRLHEYFSVAKGEKDGDKNRIYINEGAIFHFCGKAERVRHGLQGPLEFASEQNYEDFLLNRVDGDARSEQVIIPAEDYNPNLLVSDGDKLYLKYSVVEDRTYSPLNLPIILGSDYLVDFDYRGTGKIKINYLTYKDFTPEYSIETDYLDSFESNGTTLSFNFLIAEFEKTGQRLKTKQIHSGILFMPRIFRMNADVT